MHGNSARQYVLLPRRGVFAGAGPALHTLTSLPFTRSTEGASLAYLDFAPTTEVRVLDTVAESGPKLVELDDAAAAAANAFDSPVRAVPVVEYGRPDEPLRPLGGVAVEAAAGAPGVQITCLDATSGAAVEGVHVVAFTDFATRAGAEGTSDSSGKVAVQLGGASIERLYAYAPGGYWGAFLESLNANAPITVRLTPVDLGYIDSVRFYYKDSKLDLSTGVTVGVIDTGADPHSGVNVIGGRNTVTGEPAADYSDSGLHGTHVCGLIGANATPPAGLRGLAPGVPIHVYRVFPPGGGGATNYAILKALFFAAQDGCDIVNLSLGGGPRDEIVEEAISDACNQGMLVVIAAGNDGRKAVSYPAAYTGATAVSAMGREGTFPPGSLDESAILRPPSSSADPAEFIADFSNVGPQIALTAPGVGALSTLPGGKFGPLSGTSMAAPVASGAAACLLSQDKAVYGMTRDHSRSEALTKLVQTNCVRRGFGATFEGYGLPDPATV
jgi:subtilisin family serine protease